MCLEALVDRVVFFWILFVDVCELLVRILEFCFGSVLMVVIWLLSVIIIPQRSMYSIRMRRNSGD
jgi:hypothetical protein